MRYPLRLDELIAELPEAVAQDVAVGLVLRHIGVTAEAPLNDPLEKCRRVDITQTSCRTDEGSVDIGRVIHFRVDGKVSDTLARDGECL